MNLRAKSTEELRNAEKLLDLKAFSMGMAFYGRLKNIAGSMSGDEAKFAAVLVKNCNYVDDYSAKEIMEVCRAFRGVPRTIALEYFSKIPNTTHMLWGLMAMLPGSASAVTACVVRGSARPTIAHLNALANPLGRYAGDYGKTAGVIAAMYESIRNFAGATPELYMSISSGLKSPFPQFRLYSLCKMWKDFWHILSKDKMELEKVANLTQKELKANYPSGSGDLDFKRRILAMRAIRHAPMNVIEFVLKSMVVPNLDWGLEQSDTGESLLRLAQLEVQPFGGEATDYTPRQMARSTVRALPNNQDVSRIGWAFLNECLKSGLRDSNFWKFQVAADLIPVLNAGKFNLAVACLVEKDKGNAFVTGSARVQVALVNAMEYLLEGNAISAQMCFHFMMKGLSREPSMSGAGTSSHVKIYLLHQLSGILRRTRTVSYESWSRGGQSAVVSLACDGFLRCAFLKKNVEIACSMHHFLEKNILKFSIEERLNVLASLCGGIGRMRGVDQADPGFVGLVLDAACILLKSIPPTIVNRRNGMVCIANERVHSLCEVLKLWMRSGREWLQEECLQVLTCASVHHYYSTGDSLSGIFGRVCSGEFLTYLRMRHEIATLYCHGSPITVENGLERYELSQARRAPQLYRMCFLTLSVYGFSVLSDLACVAMPLINGPDTGVLDLFVDYASKTLRLGEFPRHSRESACLAMSTAYLSERLCSAGSFPVEEMERLLRCEIERCACEPHRRLMNAGVERCRLASANLRPWARSVRALNGAAHEDCAFPFLPNSSVIADKYELH